MVKIASCCWVKKRGRKVCGLAASGVSGVVEQEYKNIKYTFGIIIVRI